MCTVPFHVFALEYSKKVQTKAGYKKGSALLLESLKIYRIRIRVEFIAK